MDEYEIIDEPTGNLVRSFPTEEAALGLVRRMVKRLGEHSVHAWAMGRIDLTGTVLSGRALVARACGLQVWALPPASHLRAQARRLYPLLPRRCGTDSPSHTELQ